MSTMAPPIVNTLIMRPHHTATNTLSVLVGNCRIMSSFAHLHVQLKARLPGQNRLRILKGFYKSQILVKTVIMAPTSHYVS